MKKEIHLVCNAHIDPVWQWDWAEGVSAVLSTFASAVKLAEKFEYIFCHNEVTVYKYVEEYAPDLFEKIKALVKQGKWHIMGGWYLQPDCNMPSGESFVRQIKEGQRYFKEKFGVCPTTAINFDPFGHTVGLVQIIKKCGQDSYLFMRPYPSQLSLPSEQFVWRGLDGSEIKATRSGPYNSPLGKSALCIKTQAEKQNFPVGVVLWGVGNHGGGPSKKDLEDIENELLPSTEIQYVHSTPESFFAKIQPKEVVDTSLLTSMPGCYSSMYRVKKLHALLENELYLAEKTATVAYETGALKSYPFDELRVATEDLLNAEFHDILPGTVVQSGEESAFRFLEHGLLEAERVKIRAYFALLSAEKPATEGEYPVVVFNPHPYELTENIECEFSLADQNWDEENPSVLRVVDGDGNPVPYQIVKEESNLTLDWRKRVVFRAKLPALQLSRFSVFVEFKKKTDGGRQESFVFDNGKKRVEINPETGLLTSYQVDGKEYLNAPIELVSFDDNADPWAMDETQQRRVGENESAFVLSKTPSGVFKGMKSVQTVEDGDIYLGVEAFFEQGSTKARILYKIYKNNDFVDVDITLYLGDVNKIVKLKTPIKLQGELIGQTAYGTQPLFTDARENVAHRFVAVDGGQNAFAVFNQGVYGNHYEKGALYTSLVRGVTYCAHPIPDRPLLPTDRFTKKVDQGENAFSFRLAVTKREALERQSSAFAMKPFALNVFPVDGEKTAQKPFALRLGDETVTMSALKRMEGRDATVLRLFNNTPNSVETYVEVNGEKLPLSFTKYEVKTVLYEKGKLKEEYELLV